jgi:anti-anti-sigma factor
MPALRTEPLDQGVGLRLSGELADANALIAEDSFANLAVIGGEITIDMADVPFMDSFGLGKLIVLAIGLSGRGHLRLVNVQPTVMRVFDLVNPSGRGLAGMTVEAAPAAVKPAEAAS